MSQYECATEEERNSMGNEQMPQLMQMENVKNIKTEV